MPLFCLLALLFSPPPTPQNLLDNPELIRNMFMSNPQMQQVLEANPQLNHVLNDPALMRQTMEMARNPAAMQQVQGNLRSKMPKDS